MPNERAFTGPNLPARDSSKFCAGIYFYRCHMIAMNRMTEREADDVGDTTLRERVEAYLRFLRIPQSSMSYETRLELKRRHIESLEEAVGQRRAGFTLVEMLVAVALVILMMTLFATIFQMATNAMSTQKGLAENDQRVRLVLTRLRNDLNSNTQDKNDLTRPYRTFRNMIPFGPDEIDGLPTPFTNRDGYFYISENDPNDDTDDVLAMTVRFPAGSSEAYFGKAATVFPDSSGSFGPGNPTPGASPYPTPGAGTLQSANSPGNGQQYYPNQPEFDDLQGMPNGVGDSQYAEVCYFLRRGTLYRRVVLIRQPNVTPNPVDGTPTTDGLIPPAPSAALSLATYTNGTRNFLTDFDYSAYFDGRTSMMRFHGVGTQTNSLSATTTVINPFVLGNPAYRFGFDSSIVTVGGNPVPGPTYGLPREFISTGPAGTPASSTFFIGRFTHAETSAVNFGYPGNVSTDPTNNNTFLNFNTTTGLVSNFIGPRGGEDVLMTNVLKFDIKVFDPAGSPGPDEAPGIAGIDDDNNGTIDDNSELGWPNSDDGDFRDIGHLGLTGFYCAGPNAGTGRTAGPSNVPVTMKYQNVPSAPTLLSTLNAYSYPNPRYQNAAANVNRYETWNPMLDHDNDGIRDCPPFRPFSFGLDKRPGNANIDDDLDGITDNASEIGWPNSDDGPIPLGAIQIKVTFYDRTSKQVKESTLVQSLVAK